MLGYIVRRLLAALLVVIITSMAVFALFYKAIPNPAGPVCAAQGRCTADRLALIEESMGLNEPITTQYGKFVKGVFVGRDVPFGSSTYECDAPCFGISYGTRQPVTDQLVKAYPATLTLALGGATIYLTFGVTLGVLAARARGTIWDRGLVGFSLVISSIPYYLFALLAWIFLTLRTNIFPDTEYQPITQGVLPWIGAMLLPWLVLGIAQSTQYARFSRGEMLETLGEDYIRSASAKGVPRNKVIFKHALRAAIVPVVTIFGLDFAALLAGTVFTEKIFGIDGVGLLALDSVIETPMDLPVINATVMLAAAMVVLANLVVDILYGYLDPRVRIG
ncbi:MAG: ABC transporter permease [Nocardioides sp.]|nr:ABC transporter permease [Nocardioides sp.]